jgi:hypothetical protein
MQWEKADLADRVAKEESRVINGQRSLPDLHSNYIKRLEKKQAVDEDNADFQEEKCDDDERTH